MEPIRIPLEVIDRTAAALEQMSQRFAALERQAQSIGASFANLPRSGGDGGGLEGMAGQATNLFSKLGNVAFGFNNIVGAVQTLAAAAKPAFDFLIGSNEKLNAQLLSSQTNLASATRIFRGGVEITDPTAKIQSSQGALRTALKQIEIDTQQLVGVTSADVNNLFQITLQNAAALNNQSKQFPGPIAAAGELTKGWAASLKVIGLPLYQANQEINSIIKGQITQDSLLAKNLSITNEQVNKWKSQGILVDELNKRLAVFVSGNAIASRSIEGITSNIQDIVEILGREVGAPFLGPIVDLLDTLYKALSSNQDALRDFAKAVSKDLLGIFEQVKGIFIALSPAVLALGQAFISLGQAGLGAFIGLVQGLFGALGGLTIAIAPLLTFLAELVAGIAGLLNTDIGRFAIQVAAVIAAITLLAPVITAAVGAIGAFAVGIPALLAGFAGIIGGAIAFAAPVVAAVAAIAALGYALYRLAPAFEPLKAGLIDTFERMKTALMPAFDAIGKAIGEFGDGFGQLMTKIGPIVELLIKIYIKNLQNSIEALKPLGKFIADVFVKGAEFAANFVVVAIDSIGKLAREIADSPIGKIIGALLDKLGKLASGGEAGAANAKPDLSGLGAAYTELSGKAGAAIGDLVKASDPAAAKTAAEKLIAVTQEQLSKGVITVEQARKQLGAVINNKDIDKALREQAQGISAGLGANAEKTDALAKTAERAAAELQGSANAFADYQKATDAAKKTFEADIVDPAQAKTAAESIVKATKAAFQSKVITAEQAQQQLAAILNRSDVDAAVKTKAQQLKADIDKAAASGEAATKQQVESIQRAGTAIAAAGDPEIKGKLAEDLGTTFEQLTKKAANAQKAIAAATSSTEIAAGSKELTETTKQQLELGQITEAEAIKRLTSVATNKKAEISIQQAAQKELDAIRENGGKRQQEGLERQQQDIQQSIAQGKISRVQGEEEITKLKYQQQQIQLDNLRKALKAEEDAGRGKGKRAQDLKNQIEKAETDVAKTEESARKQRFDNRSKVQDEASKLEVANIKERIANGLITEEDGERQLAAQKAKSSAQKLKLLRENLAAEVAAGRGKGDVAKGLREQIEQSETETAEAVKAVRETNFKLQLKQREDLSKKEQAAIKQKIAGETISEAEGERLLSEQKLKSSRDRLKVIQSTLAAEIAAGRGNSGFVKSLKEQAVQTELEVAEAEKAARDRVFKQKLQDFDEQQRILEGQKATGKVSAGEASKQTLAISEAKINTELAEINRKRSKLRSSDKEGFEALAAAEADIYKRRSDNLQKYQDEQIRILEQSQKKAFDQVKLTETQQEIGIAKLIGAGLVREVEVGEERAKAKKKQSEIELSQERQRLAALESLPKLSDPDREAERQSKIRASRQKTAELTLSLVQQQAAVEDAIAAKVKDRLDQEIKGIQNDVTAKEQAANREIELQGYIEKAYDRQNKLIQSRKGLFDALKSYSEGEYSLALQFTEGEEAQRAIREESARQRLAFLTREQEFERQSLELEIQKNAALLKREEIQNRIEQARAQADLAKESANLKKAAIDLGRGKITQQDFEAQKLTRDAAQARVTGSKEQGDLLKEQTAIDAQDAINRRAAQAKKFDLSRDQARAEVAKETKTKTDDVALQREFLGKARSSAKEVKQFAVVDRPPIVSRDAVAQKAKVAPNSNAELIKSLSQFEVSVKAGVQQLVDKPAGGTIKQTNNFPPAKTDQRDITKQLYSDLYDLSNYGKTRKN